MQDLTAYKKYKEKAVASAARSLITLFREIAPYMLEKKDRGRGADLDARPMQYGAGQIRVSTAIAFLPNAVQTIRLQHFYPLDVFRGECLSLHSCGTRRVPYRHCAQMQVFRTHAVTKL